MNNTELVVSYMNLARSVARSICERNESLRAYSDDILSGAFEGLVVAGKKFDPSRGVPFGSFALPHISTSALRAGRTLLGALDKKHRICARAERPNDMTENEWFEQIGATGEHETSAGTLAVDKLLSILRARVDEREFKFWVERYVHNKSCEKIGVDHSLSRIRVYQIIQKVAAVVEEISAQLRDDYQAIS